jgi:CRISPR-associated endonuclease Cas1
MHADDANYTAVKNGVVVVSGTGPAIRIDGNRLVIRDGPQETRPLVLSRAEASRKLRHIIVCGHAGGFVTFDALRWLRDTDVAFSQLDWDGTIIIASGPRGQDRAALRRAQALVCSGVTSKMAVVITREILRVKLEGQAAVAALLGSADASRAIDQLAARMVHETDGAKVLSVEASAALVYWRTWRNVSVRFARRNPQRLGPDNRWRPGRSEQWLTFGPRASLLTGEPFRATTPGNALLNYLYAILESEMTVALLAVGLDPSIGIFHADLDGRSSMSLDAIEAVRPHVDYWLFAYLTSSAFANRDFTELSDGEVRLTHPLNSRLAHTAALWRQICEPVANWLARSLSRATGFNAALADHLKPPGSQTVRSMRSEQRWNLVHFRSVPPIRGPARGRWPIPLQDALKDNPVPLTCWECGKGFAGNRLMFCSKVCARAFPVDRLHILAKGPTLPATVGSVGRGR